MNKPQHIWILTCMAMVVLMVFIGGVTRLTESGLSIVEWKLVTGILPPLTDAGWEAELEAYRSSPEYQIVNKGMSVAEFKRIFWLEWLHRLLGRLTGMVFITPLLYFVARKQINTPLAKQMSIACLLVAAQGTLGWLMVYSGLQQDPRVSPLRLAAHLSLAFTLFCYLLWIYLRAKQYARLSPQQAPRHAAWAVRSVTALIAVQIIFGAFVAGMDAGLIYNTWPLMDGDWVPSNLLMLEPWYSNLYAYVPMVQWQHRSFAFVVAAAVVAACLYIRKSAPTILWAHLLGIMVLQFALGVFTLLYVVPISLASAHQLVALALLAASVRLCYAYPVMPKKKLN